MPHSSFLFARPFRTALGLLGFLAALPLVGCNVSYPHCSHDGDCSQRGEVCVLGMCQECATDKQCDAKYPGAHRTCQQGRCEGHAECTTDDACKALGKDLVCKNGMCQPECTRADECPTGKTCVSQKCVKSCATELDCPQNAICAQNVCVDKALVGAEVRGSCHPTKDGDTVDLPTIVFPFNQSDLGPDARQQLEHAAECLRQAPSTLRVIVEGHCDDRGTQEYNLALGERRAQAVLTYLKSLGAPAASLEVVSKGENEPVCTEATDTCFAQNRRVQFLQRMAAP